MLDKMLEALGVLARAVFWFAAILLFAACLAVTLTL